VNLTTRVHRRLAQMAGLELGWRVVAGEILAWAVAVLALVMSYHAEQDLGQSLAVFRGWPAVIWPLSVDLPDVALMVLYLEYKRLRLSTWKVWLGMVVATAVMVAANIRSAWPDPTAVAMQAWVPSIALWLWHTLAAGRRPRGAPVDLAVVWARVIGALPQDSPVEEHQAGGAHVDPEPRNVRNPQPRVAARAEVQRLLRRHRGPLTDDALRRLAVRVHKRTGVSIRHAHRLLREEQEPHVVRLQPAGGDAKQRADL
jgi:Protein of unknown function (DUF2637)